MLLTTPLLGTSTAASTLSSNTAGSGSAWGFAASAAGLASSVIGSYFSSQSAKINAETNAYIAETNAKIQRMGAESSMMQGQRQMERVGEQAGQVKSSQKASLAGRGIDMAGGGTASELLASTDLNKQQDFQTIRSNAVMSAWGYSTAAANSQIQAAQAQSAANQTNPAGSAFSALLGSGGQVAQQWYAYNRAGSY